MPTPTDHVQGVQPPVVAPSESGRSPNADREDSVSLPLALREIPLSEEAAEAMRTLLYDKSRPGAVGQEMPSADASVLLEKTR